jgi:hypothetical protein
VRCPSRALLARHERHERHARHARPAATWTLRVIGLAALLLLIVSLLLYSVSVVH